MDIHRCRFVPYLPSAITALAFSHPSTSDRKETSPPDLRLALGRSNGDVELWNPNKGNWYQETVFNGGRDRNIEDLAWTADSDNGNLRLFSVGTTSYVTEWDIDKGVPKRNVSGNFGDIWCLAAQPASTASAQVEKEKPRLLAAGCQDGTIALFITEDSDLRYLRQIGKPSTKKTNVLSIAWQNSNTIVAGYSDSTIRVFDSRSRNILRTISLGKPVEGNDTYVWTLRCLPDGTIISGDSNGDLKIWDSRNYSLTQQIQGHKADVLCITSNANGDMIITGGADQRTVAYKLFGDKVGGEKRRRWGQIMHRRFHEHDVKALAEYESADLSVVVSGGLDFSPVIVPLRNLGTEYHRKLSHLPQRPQLQASPSSRTIMTWQGQSLDLWRVSKSTETGQSHQLVAQLELSGDEGICSAAISKHGKLLAVVTATSLKMFRLRKSKISQTHQIKIRSVVVPTNVARIGGRQVTFSPDSRWLCIVKLDNDVAMLRIKQDVHAQEPAHILKHVVTLTKRQVPTRKEKSSLSDYINTTTTLSFSTDSRILACGDLGGCINSWLLEGREDLEEELRVGQSIKHRQQASAESDDESSDDEDEESWICGQRWLRNPSSLPILDAEPLILSFRPGPTQAVGASDISDVGLHATRHNPHPLEHELPLIETRLLALTANQHIFELDVGKGRLTDWTRRNPANYLPKAFTKIKSRAMGCFWDINPGHERVWLYGSTWIFMLDLSQDLERPSSADKAGKQDVLNPLQNGQKKRKRHEHFTQASKTGHGAGDRKAAQELEFGVASDLIKFTTDRKRDLQIISMATDNGVGEVFEGTDSSALVQLRRQAQLESEQANGSLVNGSNKPFLNGHDAFDIEQDQGVLERRPDQPSTHWLTQTYRSVLGIVVLQTTEVDTELATRSNAHEQGDRLEVAIIERPIWDIPLTDRCDTGQDWSTHS